MGLRDYLTFFLLDIFYTHSNGFFKHTLKTNHCSNSITVCTRLFELPYIFYSLIKYLNIGNLLVQKLEANCDCHRMKVRQEKVGRYYEGRTTKVEMQKKSGNAK